ncbi:MAG: DegT/DnrJ/EryC1/StrS family aminotransferase [Abitibacteriaceae bacterium]|nr:DegT/DnrJ/EryC1/StrS family aminotransferase [Abditibacteriaceae bacterium]MBV9867608.1 DegT/DnrJ/EryC1/StrS family aminotransferase [Abditibacteriaceae bacterium]
MNTSTTLSSSPQITIGDQAMTPQPLAHTTEPAASSTPSAISLRPRPRLGLGATLIGEEEKALVLDVLQRQALNRYQGGTMAAQLEEEFREVIGTRFALAVTSGTVALEVALAALGIGPGDEVIITAWGWVACFTAVVRLGALPVLAEIDDTFCLAPGEITRLANERTKAVAIVHYQGVAAAMQPLLDEAAAVGIKVIEDCAQSLGVLYHGQRVGSMGDIGTYSLQHSKTLTSGEGGMVVMNDPILYERAVRMHDLGLLRPYHEKLVERQVPAFSGSQFRMNELTAAVALAQLRKLDRLREHCRNLQQIVMSSIRDLPGLAFRHIPDPQGDTGFEVYLQLPTPAIAEAFRTRLDALNVNCHQTTGTYCHYAREYCQTGLAHTSTASPFTQFPQWPAPGYRQEDFPRTEALIHRFVALPLSALYTEEDAHYIGACIRHVHSQVMA